MFRRKPNVTGGEPRIDTREWLAATAVFAIVAACVMVLEAGAGGIGVPHVVVYVVVVGVVAAAIRVYLVNRGRNR